MGEELHIGNVDLEFIARISHGKDSLKMLDVIITRGLRLDRITSTDVWATDTIRAELPEMVAFKDRADEYIWQKYRIEVEHLCAMRNGEKLTYEKMFYHVPNRKPSSSGGGGYCQKQAKATGFPCTNIPLVSETQNQLYTASQCLSPEKASGARNSKPGF